MEIKELRKKAMSLPLSPGVYIMKNKNGEVIYVGKAKKLKNRVSQYFGSPNGHAPKVRKMVENVRDFDYILTGSEFEALVLECSLIKQYDPKYNILLRDDKGYCYIKVTKGPWQKIVMARKKEEDGAVYIGPYMSSSYVESAIEEARKIFSLPDCTRNFSEKKPSGKPCLNYYIKQCCAPCTGKVTEKQYRENVKAAVDFLKGDSKDVVNRLTAEMETAAENLDFETAAKFRDRIRAINKIGEKQKVIGIRNQDSFALVKTESKCALSVLRFSDGKLRDNVCFMFDGHDDLPQLRRELITGFYSEGRDVPEHITADGPVEDTELLCQWLKNISGKNVSISVPQRGKQAEITEMSRNNASQKLALYLGRNDRATAALDELTKLLGLKSVPVRIESYDISHTAGADNVAGMVVFRNGVPDRENYRRFSIKGFKGQDDYASMAEVISRRFNRYELEKESGKGFGELPDLILLDGGTGQINAVRPIVESFAPDIPVFGMVKDNRHRTRAIASDGGEISIGDTRRAFTLVSGIQEEVHRYAVTYHRTKHKKSSLAVSLMKIDGVGEKRCRALLKEFKTVSAIREADVERLTEAEGINRATAEKVYNYFKNNIDN